MLNSDLVWITYRGTFDMGYMLKLATSEELPDTEAGFFEKLQTYFPHFYDIKCMLCQLDLSATSLNSTATLLNVDRFYCEFLNRSLEQARNIRPVATVS
jgi:CCR4-NOT transcription complex subunit 7/8